MSDDVYLTAKCGDTMLAKSCLADLQQAGFAGKVSLETSTANRNLDQLERRPFGTNRGSRHAVRMFVGGALGAVAGAVCALAFPQIPAAYFSAGGFLIGAFWTLARTSAGDEVDDSIVLRCEGTNEQMAVAYFVLQRSACRTLTAHHQPEHIKMPTQPAKK